MNFRTLTLASVITIVMSAAAPAQEPIKFGAIVAATGPGAGVGIPQRNGIQLAIKLINQQGGINGRPIQLFMEDDASNPDTALTKANNLVFNHKVKAIFGPSQTAQVLAVGSITDPLKLPIMAYTGLGVPIESQRRCAYHMSAPQELNARALLEYATKELKTKKIGVLHDSAYGNVVMGKLREVAKDYGITEFVATEKWEVGATDITTQAAKVKAANPDAVLVIGNSATPFRNVRQLRWNVPLISAIGTATYEYQRAMGDAADNIIHAEFLVGEDPMPYQVDFVNAFKAEYGVLPKMWEASAFDSVNAVVAAMRKVGPDASYPELCEAIRGPYQGAMAKFNWAADDLTGLTLKSYVFSKLEKGKWTRTRFVAGD
jgi:branched-chain amino acid transport system substrate-binding protein